MLIRDKSPKTALLKDIDRVQPGSAANIDVISTGSRDSKKKFSRKLFKKELNPVNEFLKKYNIQN